MSDTPETEKAEFIYNGIEASGYVEVELAQKLERERNEARECYQVAMKLAAQYKSERNQWRECAERLAERLNWWAGPPQQIGGHQESIVALREFERLKEETL